MSSTLDLDRLKGLVEIMAAERTKDSPHLFEDAVQEGMIAAWQASEKRPDAPAAYVHGAARNGVGNVVRGRPMTGEEGRRGWSDAHDASGPLVVEGTDGKDFFVADPADVSAADALAATEIRREVRAAVGALPEVDRVTVVGRYWCDLGFADLAKVTGRPAGTLSRRWTEKVRPALAETLKEIR